MPEERIQLSLTQKQKEAARLVMERMDAASMSEVFRRTLLIMAKIDEVERTKGVKFGFVDEESTFTEVWLI